MDAIDSLTDVHADVNALTKTKLNMLHVAAQSDQVNSLYYFKLKNLDLNAIDDEGQTPMHWALH